MPRERRWSFEGITCDYVQEDHNSYYEIIIAIMPLKKQGVLERLQAYFTDLDAVCAIQGETRRNKTSHVITRLCLSRDDAADVEALYQEIMSYGLIPIIASSTPLSASVSSSSAESSSSLSRHSTETCINHADQVDINQAYVGGNHTHKHKPYTPGLIKNAKRLGKQIQSYSKEKEKEKEKEKVYVAFGPIPKCNEHFSGREDVLKSLIKRFIVRDEGGQQVLPPTVLYQTATGLGGVGKTQVAARYVHLCQAQQRAAKARDGSAPDIFHDVVNAIQSEERPFMPGVYHAIVWLDARDESSLLRSFRSVAQKIGLIFEPQQADDLESVREAVYTLLGHLPRVLWVWDDVTEATAIHEHLPTDSASTWQGKCDCLLTTRDRLLAERYHGLEVGVFSREESVAYLKHALILKIKPNKDLKRLAMTLGHLPLALAQAVSYLNHHKGRVDIPEYLKRYSSNRTELLDKLPTGNDRYLETVLTTWLLSIGELSQTRQGAQAVQLLLGSSFLSGPCIEYDVLQAYMKQSDVGLEELIDCLSHYSLVDGLSEQPAIRVHALVQDVIQLWLKGNVQTHVQKSTRHDKTRGAKVSSSLEKLANNLSLQKVPHTWIDIAGTLHTTLLEHAQLKDRTMAELARRKLLLPHLETFISRLQPPADSLRQRDSSSSLSLPNRLAMNLYHAQGVIAWGHGHYQDAKRAFESCLCLKKTHYGESHVEVSGTLVNLGVVLGDLGEPQAAKTQLERGLGIQEVHYGQEHMEVARTLGNLGNVLGYLGDYLGKKALFERVLRIQEVRYGEDHVEVARTLVNLGTVLEALGNYPSAKALLERALGIQEAHAHYGKDHVEVAVTLNNLGIVLGNLGDHQKKKILLERALVILGAYYEQEHVEVAKTLNNLGIVLRDLDEPQAAKASLEQALAIREAYYGKDHVEVAVTLNNLGIVLRDLGDPQAAKTELERALRILESHYGKEHMEVAITLVSLGTVLGDPPAAKALFERALGIQEAHYGQHHVELVVTLFNLGMTNKALGNIQEAMRYLLRASIIMTSTSGYESHPNLRMITDGLKILESEHPKDYAAVALAAQQPSPAKAKPSLSMPELLAESDSPAKRNDAGFQGYVGHRCFGNNQPVLALVYYERAIQLSPITTLVYHNAACCYHITGSIERAQLCFEQGIAYRPTSGIHIKYAHFLYLQQRYAQALEHIQASRSLPVGELSYGVLEKSVIAPLLQRLLSSDKKTIELPTDGFGYYLAYECYLGLGQLNAAEEALNQLRQYCDNTRHEALTTLYALTSSLAQRSSEAIRNGTLSSSSNSFFQPPSTDHSLPIIQEKTEPSHHGNGM